MDAQLTKVIMDGLDAARFQPFENKGSYRLVAGGRSYPVLRVWKSGFAMTAEDAPQLRGVVELYQGDRFVLTGLAMANAPEGGEIVFEFKRATHVTDHPPLDFVAHAEVPLGVPL